MNFKKLLLFLFPIMFLLFFSLGNTLAEENTNKFLDVEVNHWANQAITQMAEKNIITGYSDSTFKPNNTVSRAEFAKMMVAALNLPTKKPETPTFKDVGKDHWLYPYAESAKYYLTGFRSPDGDYFKPSLQAAREDMAVALVKALGYTDESVDESILDKFSDSSAVSPNLRKYIAIAAKHNIMEGSSQEDSLQLIFKPQLPLTRAEAAVLLYKVMKEEKITYENETQQTEKVTYDEKTQQPEKKPTETPKVKPNYPVSTVTGKIDDNRIVLNWKPIHNDKFQGYKVVISKNNSKPKYPDDGYLYWITDKNKTSAIVDNHEPYNSGDFGKYLVPGQKYYFSITAVYSDKKVPGNVITLTYPKQSSESSDYNSSTNYGAPKVSGKIDGNKIILNWNRIYSEKLQGYKVVISESNSKPKYPDDGYLYWITDTTRTSTIINNEEPYKNGDFGSYLVSGQKYYFSVTAVYNDEKIPGNVLTLTFPGSD